MREQKKELKRRKIEQAAYDLIEIHGYEGVSMLKIAKRARASNETLYRWYGDKKGLFQSLVQSNAAEIKQLLEADNDTPELPLDTLAILGSKLLSLLVGGRAVALNRAAAADPSGELGRALAQSGREIIMPLVAKVFERIGQHIDRTEIDAAKYAELYLRLLVGDLQIRRTTGALKRVTEDEITQRTYEAQTLIIKLAKMD